MSSSSSLSSSSEVQTLQGIVKQIFTGDCVVIRSDTGTPPAEKNLLFVNIYAPKIARRPCHGNAETVDEQWAWESREFLRRKILGERVTFTMSTESGRNYGCVWLGDQAKGENVIESMVAAGYAMVRHDVKASPDLQKLYQLEKSAKRAKLGMWSSVSPGCKERRVVWSPDLRQLINRYGLRPVNAIIEHVRDGSTIRAFLLPDNPNVPYAVYNYVTMGLAGICCPGYQLDNTGQPDHRIEVPYADEARFFVECRLLQREVQLVLESLTNDKILGRVLHWRGDIAVSLLREGLARCVDRPMLKTEANYRQAELEAQRQRKRLWQHLNKSDAHNDREFMGVVIEVTYGDGVIVLTADGIEKKVMFALIRPPNGDVFRNGKAVPTQYSRHLTMPSRRLFDIPWMFEAREFLRLKLLREKVHCTHEYSMPSNDGRDRVFYTVLFNGQNVAEMLVARGLARVGYYVEHKDIRSTAQERLLAAWEQAVRDQVGIHSMEKRSPKRLIDLTLDSSHLRHHYLPVWQRQEETEGVVEFVMTGSRMRLHIPKQNCLVVFALAGIQCPRASSYSASNGHNELIESFGDEAVDFTRYKVLQRNVRVKIECTDKSGSAALGWLWTPNNENLAVMLLQEGLAQMHGNANKFEFYRQMRHAQCCAQAAKLNIWSKRRTATVVQEIPPNGEETVTQMEPAFRSVFISKVGSGEKLTFFAQYLDRADDYNKMNGNLQDFYKANPRVIGNFSPKKGALCGALFSYDNSWYRATILHLDEGRMATVKFIDFGNEERVAFDDMAALPGEFVDDPPYAIEYKLALVHLPIDADEREELLRWFSTHVADREMKLSVEFKPRSAVPAARVCDPATNEDVGLKMIADGMAFVDKDLKNRLTDLYKVYIRAQQRAHQAHTGIWRYGDARQDDQNA